MEPAEPARNIMPSWAILGFGLGGLAFTMPDAFKALPPQAQVLICCVVVLLAISDELQLSRQKTAHKEFLAAMSANNKARPLPKMFEMKMQTEVQSTPSEFADALADEEMRAQWELKLKSIKKKALNTMTLEFANSTV